jgi:hypothetical protein
MYFSCRLSDSTESADTGIEPRTFVLAVRRSNHSARSHPLKKYRQEQGSFFEQICRPFVGVGIWVYAMYEYSMSSFEYFTEAISLQCYEGHIR